MKFFRDINNPKGSLYKKIIFVILFFIFLCLMFWIYAGGLKNFMLMYTDVDASNTTDSW